MRNRLAFSASVIVAVAAATVMATVGRADPPPPGLAQSLTGDAIRPEALRRAFENEVFPFVRQAEECLALRQNHATEKCALGLAGDLIRIQLESVGPRLAKGMEAAAARTGSAVDSAAGEYEALALTFFQVREIARLASQLDRAPVAVSPVLTVEKYAARQVLLDRQADARVTFLFDELTLPSLGYAFVSRESAVPGKLEIDVNPDLLLPASFALTSLLPSRERVRDALGEAADRILALERATLTMLLPRSEDPKASSAGGPESAFLARSQSLTQEVLFRETFIPTLVSIVSKCNAPTRDLEGYIARANGLLLDLFKKHSALVEPSVLESLAKLAGAAGGEVPATTDEVKRGLLLMVEDVAGIMKSTAAKIAIDAHLRASAAVYHLLDDESLAAALLAGARNVERETIETLVRVLFPGMGGADPAAGRDLADRIREFVEAEAGDSALEIIRSQLLKRLPGSYRAARLAEVQAAKRFDAAAKYVDAAYWIEQESQKLETLNAQMTVTPEYLYAGEDLDVAVAVLAHFEAHPESSAGSVTWYPGMLAALAGQMHTGWHSGISTEVIRAAFGKTVARMGTAAKLAHAIAMEGHEEGADESSTVTQWTGIVAGWTGLGAGSVPVVDSHPNGAIREFQALHERYLRDSDSYRFAGPRLRLKWIGDGCQLDHCRNLAEAISYFHELAEAHGILALGARAESVVQGILSSDLGATRAFSEEIGGLPAWIDSHSVFFNGVAGSASTQKALAMSLLRDPAVYLGYRKGQMGLLRAKLGGVFLRTALPPSLQAVAGPSPKMTVYQLILTLIDAVSAHFFAENKLRPVLDRLLAPGSYQSVPSSEVLLTIDLAALLRPGLARASEALSGFEWFKLEANRTQESWWVVPLRKADLFPLVARIQAAQKSGADVLPSVDEMAQDLAVAALLRPVLRAALDANDRVRACLEAGTCESDRALLKSNAVSVLTDATGPLVAAGVQSMIDETFAWEKRLDRWSKAASNLSRAGTGAALAAIFLPVPPVVGALTFGGAALSSLASTGVAALQAADLWVTARATAPLYGTGISGKPLLDPAVPEEYADRFNRQMSHLAYQVPMEVVFQGMVLTESLSIAKAVTGSWIRSWGLAELVPSQAEKEAMARLGLKPEMTGAQATKTAKSVRAAAHPDKLGPGADPLSIDLAAANFSQLNEDWRVAKVYFERVERIEAAGGIRARILKVLRKGMGEAWSGATIADDVAPASAGQQGERPKALLTGPTSADQPKAITMQPSDEDFARVGMNRGMTAREAEAQFRKFTEENNPVILQLSGKMTEAQARKQYADVWAPAYEAWQVRLQPYFRGQ